jgi:endonuclease/exonuclease/phosphatase (EEP) superfamily protein YafD
MKRFSIYVATLACWAYFTFLFGWLAAYLLTGDRYVPVSIANFFGVYWFLPLPITLLLAIPLRKASVWAGAILGAVVFAWMWGGLFLPPLPSGQAMALDGDSLTVMTYNLLGRVERPLEQVAVIRGENPDLVCLQELNPPMAQAVEQELGAQYPYQDLHPGDGVIGMGIISKYPLRETGARLPLQWVGRPQVLEVDWNGLPVTVVNFHMVPTNTLSPQRISDENDYRQGQAQALVELAQKREHVILCGDANTTPLTQAYQILANGLEDTWVQAGFGLGHTFPGSDLPGSSRPHIAGRSVPQWLMRIDYIFITSDWQTLEAHMARFDYVSDHRGVVAVLTLHKE